MMNEMQAYLMHTRNFWFFDPRDVGVSDERLAALQADFLLGMPSGCLRDRASPLDPPGSSKC